MDPKTRRRKTFVNAAMFFFFTGFLAVAFEASHWFQTGDWVTIPVSFPLQYIPGLVPAIDAWLRESSANEWLTSKVDQWLMAPLSWALAAIGCLALWVASLLRPDNADRGDWGKKSTVP
jgi:hypothetical protein